MVVHAEQAEAKRNNVKAGMEAILKSMHEMEGQLTKLKALNDRMLVQHPQREKCCLP